MKFFLEGGSHSPQQFPRVFLSCMEVLKEKEKSFSTQKTTRKIKQKAMSTGLATSTTTTTTPSQRNNLPPLQPSDLPQLVQLLQNCLSNDFATQKQAEKTVHEIEKRNGFFSLLMVRVRVCKIVLNFFILT